MITLLNEKRLADGTYFLNFSLDTEADLDGLSTWVNRVGPNYGVPVAGSTATVESTGETYIKKADGTWSKGMANIIEKTVNINANGTEVKNASEDNADGYSKVTIVTNVTAG